MCFFVCSQPERPEGQAHVHRPKEVQHGPQKGKLSRSGAYNDGKKYNLIFRILYHHEYMF